MSTTTTTFSPPIGYIKPDGRFYQLRYVDGTPGTVVGFDSNSNLAMITPAGGGSDDPFELFNILAAEAIPAYSVVTVTGKNANSATLGDFWKVLGVSTAAIANTFTGDVVTSGTITNGAWAWSPGAVLYLNGTTISQTAPSGAGTNFVIPIGKAKTATTIFVAIGEPVLL